MSIEKKKIQELLSYVAIGAEKSEKHEKYRAGLDYAKLMYDKDFGIYQSFVDETALVGGRVIDIGSGAGHWSLALAEKNAFVLGIDINPEYTWLSRLVAANAEAGYKIHFITASAEAVAYPEDFFDSLVCHGVMMFTDHDAAAEEFKRLLKPLAKAYIGYSGMGWYLRYLIKDGLAEGNEGRLQNGLAVLLNSVRYEAGLSTPEHRWIGITSERIRKMMESKGFLVDARPGLQDGFTSFLGIEATYDFLFSLQPTNDGDALGRRLSLNADERILWLLDIIETGDVAKALETLAHPEMDELGQPRLAALICRAFMKAGRLDEARAFERRFGGDTPWMRYARALSDHANRRFSMALEKYASVFEARERDAADARFLQAEVYREQGELAKAEEIHEAVFHESNEKDFRAWLGLMACHFHRQEKNEMKKLAKAFAERAAIKGGQAETDANSLSL